MSQVNKPEKPTQVRWLIFSLAGMTSWMLYLHRNSFGAIKPLLAEEYGFNKAQLGDLDAWFSGCYGLFQIPLGVLADIAGVHIVLSSLIVVWATGLAWHAFATAEHLWMARASFGIGQSAVYACLARLSRSWYPSHIRTTMQGVAGVTLGRLGGASTSLILGTIMIGTMGLSWQTSTYCFAIMGLALGIAFITLYRNKPADHFWTNQAEIDLLEDSDKAEVIKTEKLSWRDLSPRSIVNLVFLNVQTILSTLADNIYSNWIPLFLFEVYALEYKQMGYLWLLPLLGGALGGWAGGAFNDWMIRRTGSIRFARTVVGLAGKGTASIALFGALFAYDHPYVFCGLLFFVKFFADITLTTTWGACTDIGGRQSASVFAYNNSVATGGSILAPYIYGRVAQNWGWYWVFVIACVAYLLCALSWLVIDCSLKLVTKNEQHEGKPE